MNRPSRTTSPHMACYDDTALVVTIPLQLVSESNLREHWAAKHRRKKDQQSVVSLMLSRAMRFMSHSIPLPLLVTLTRMGSRKMDKDGNVASFKHVQDAVAAWLGVDDGDENAVTWDYEQETGKGVAYALRIRIEPRPTPPRKEQAK